MTRYKQICQNREIKCREISPFTNCVCVSYCGACRWIVVVVWGCRRTFMCAEAKIILRGNSKHPLFAPIRPSANLRAFLCFSLSKFPDWKGLSYSFPATTVIPSFFSMAQQHRPNELALTPTRWFRFCICFISMYVVNLSSTIDPLRITNWQSEQNIDIIWHEMTHFRSAGFWCLIWRRRKEIIVFAPTNKRGSVFFFRSHVMSEWVEVLSQFIFVFFSLVVWCGLSDRLLGGI